MKMNVSPRIPKEQEAYEIGTRDLLLSAAARTISRCATCHGVGQPAHPAAGPAEPHSTPADAQRAYGAWPAYRVSQGEVRSFQWRLNDCFRQQRFPELEFVSPASIALTMFLAKNANGGVFDAPSIKR